MKKTGVLFLTLISLLLMSGCNSETKKAEVIQSKTTTIKEVLPKSLILTTTDDKTIELNYSDNILLSKNLNGKTVLINFFASWCAPCIKEIPTFNRLYEKYSDTFEIVGILYEQDKDMKELNDFIVKHNIKFPVTIGNSNFIAAKMFGNVQKVPESFLFSKEGFFVEKFIGVANEEKLENYIKNSK